MVELRKVDAKNIWKICALEVAEDQRSFVATNTQSILEAYCAISSGGVAMPYGIYDGETPVGFVMLGFGCEDWEDAPKIAKDTYNIWRFMIDRRYQRKGYGKQAMEAVLRLVETFPHGKEDWVWLSYEPENQVAAELYRSFGFRENGQMDGDEIIAVRPLT
ncbi:MAG: GNAT family N-acetyltransferase [Candidatus Faecousia sp.]|nr:GNAT family N-acetyltransferase [Candidatus Faecousia sp.]